MSENRGDVLLEVQDLCKHYPVTKGAFKRAVGVVKAVDGVSFEVRRGEILALVGESGCGKTTTGRCILRAIEPTSGSVRFRLEGGAFDMASLDRRALKEARRHMGLVFQDPYSSLNPRMSVLEIVGEPFVNHGIAQGRGDLEDRVAALLKSVKLDPEYMHRYPHAFSGGQRQRIAIARALALNPEFVVADEPVSALDVSVQAQILQLLRELRDQFHLTYLFVAHNLAVVEYISGRVVVMYVGKIVEMGDTKDIFFRPKHPYTEALMSAIPKAQPELREGKRRIVLNGDVADPANPPTGCYFHPRCVYAEEICRREAPALADRAPAGGSPHMAACHLADRLSLIGVPEGTHRAKYRLDVGEPGPAR